ncbi:aminodeoxychorismate/anthranilate synthase component II [Streptomyces sp. ventii]|uniref:Aminodeoxychorismate/anthranilate synthase component II n=1 Tax=Streptomyces spiramenti TaxID=2720606 RepID=A0ABX1ALK1_9ACTN|nr:aminodeoxychorismate/anthranilate synthase component II [Streptomyces spiramenti]
MSDRPRVLVVDAFDSFVDILRQYLLTAGASSQVVRSDRIRPSELPDGPPDGVVLGPGPGHPDASGHVELARAFAGRLPVLGVCLGHQALARAFGGEVVPAARTVHGRTSRITHDGRGLFRGMPATFEATRYHSLIVAGSGVPPELRVTARSEDDGYVMGLRHRSLPLESVQFHPESFRTDHGQRIVANFVELVDGHRCRAGRPRAARPGPWGAPAGVAPSEPPVGGNRPGINGKAA